MTRINTEEMRKRLDSGTAAVFDVRGDVDFERGHIPGAKTAAQVRVNVGALEAGPLALDQMVRIEGLRASALDTVRSYYDPEPADD